MKKALKYLAGIVAFVAVVDALYLAAIWPDWDALAKGPAPRSRFMRDWEASNGKKPAWQPVSIDSVPEPVQRVFVVAEDSGFWQHHGFDFESLHEALSKDVRRHRIAFGGSTISQQTAKNLFLTPSRSPLRKWHEAWLTAGLERHLGKKRILEIYLDDVELGPGVYGVEAAAEAYFGVHAADLDQEKAIELAATLPDPREDNPSTADARFHRRVERIRRWLEEADELEAPSRSPSPIAAPAPALVTSGGSIAAPAAISE